MNTAALNPAFVAINGAAAPSRQLLRCNATTRRRSVDKLKPQQYISISEPSSPASAYINRPRGNYRSCNRKSNLSNDLDNTSNSNGLLSKVGRAMHFLNLRNLATAFTSPALACVAPTTVLDDITINYSNGRIQNRNGKRSSSKCKSGSSSPELMNSLAYPGAVADCIAYIRTTSCPIN